MPDPRARDEQGSIAIAMMITFMATALTAALLTTVFRDIRVSRRSGDSANALQVADAGINEAVKAVRTEVGTVGVCPAPFHTMPGFSRTSTIAGGSYTYCAASEVDVAGRPVWHLDSVGTDATGVKRRVRASAVAEPRFPEAIHVLSSASFSAGFSVDSYKDEASRCTRKGRVGSNDPATLTFGSSGVNTSANCQNVNDSGVPTGAWPHPPDGCVAYSRDGTATFPSSKIGTGQCPPSHTTTDSPEFFRATATSTGPVDFPAAPATAPGANFECNTATLQPGKTYYFVSVKLSVGCGVATAGVTYPALANPVKIYTQNLNIAGGKGNSGTNHINPPPDSATVCGPSHGTGGTVGKLYCPGWAGSVQIEVMGGGSSPEVRFTGNFSTFWGVINAPSSTADWQGGSPQWEVFGSMVIKSVVGGVQAKWHYDESLGSITTGRFFARQWREEPLS